MKHPLAWLVLAITTCCARPTAPPDDITVTSATACSRACVHLRDLGCPEGTSPHCVPACETMAALSSAPAACWLDAGTVDAVKACGGVRCVP